MENLFHAADQSVTPDNLSQQITDEIFNNLKWEDVEADALDSFFVKFVEASPGPEGITVLYGVYPLIDDKALFALTIFFSDGETDLPPAGLHFQRAAVGKVGA